MALRACRECGVKISHQAMICPHCGRKNPTQTDSEKIFGGYSFKTVAGTAAVLLLVVLLNHHSHSDSSATTATPVPVIPAAAEQSTAAPTPAPVPVAEPVKEKTYKAIITCSTVGADNAQVLPFACFVHDTGIKVTIDGRSRLYKAPDLMGMAGNNRALVINLPEHFEIVAQNSEKYLMLTVTIKDEDGKVVFEDQADQYGVVHVGN